MHVYGCAVGKLVCTVAKVCSAMNSTLGDIGVFRGCVKDSPGWTVALQRPNGFHEIAGYDHVLDLLSSVELPDGFPIGDVPGAALGSLQRNK